MACYYLNSSTPSKPCRIYENLLVLRNYWSKLLLILWSTKLSRCSLIIDFTNTTVRGDGKQLMKPTLLVLNKTSSVTRAEYAKMNGLSCLYRALYFTFSYSALKMLSNYSLSISSRLLLFCWPYTGMLQIVLHFSSICK